MKKISLLLAALALSMVSCQKEEANSESFGIEPLSASYAAAALLPVTTVSGTITTDTTWDNDHVWEIQGVVVVKNGATLTIEAGTYIKGDPSVSDPTGVLVISKTGEIDAQGTDTDPIVFTSYNLLDGDAGTDPAPKDFGGVILLSDGISNAGTDINIEGLENNTDYQFGGTATEGNEHSNGILEYVRIEYAGRDLGVGDNSGNEINGLTCGAVGNTTTISYIQVSYGYDDSFEFFGGTVDCDHLISFAPQDDNFDFDNGYTGTIEYAIALADENSGHSGSTSPDSNGIELDNDSSGSSATPITHPTIEYLSIIGMDNTTDASLYENAMHIRRNGEITLIRALVSGYNIGVYFDSPSVIGNSTLTSNRIHGYDLPATDDKIATISLPFGNGTSTAAGEDWGVTQPFFNAGTLDFSYSGTRGAFESGDWTATWAEFDF